MFLSDFWSRIMKYSILVCIIVPLLSSSCMKDSSLNLKKEDFILQSRINTNVENIKILCNCSLSGLRISSVITSREELGGIFYHFRMEDDSSLQLFSRLSSQRPYPHISISYDETEYYWTVEDDWFTDSNGRKVPVGFSDTKILFSNNNEWEFSVDGTSKMISSSTSSDNERDIVINYDETNRLFVFIFKTGVELVLYTTPDFSISRRDVLNDAYYNDIFLDAGIGLTSRTSLYAASTLKMSLEAISLPRSVSEASVDDIALQNAVFGGSEVDTNGWLLYPDGQPRYRLLFVNGGSSTSHGLSLDWKSLENIRLFVNNGGSYVGACAGAFFASNGYDSVDNYDHYLSLWPAIMNHTGLSDIYTEMTLEKNSPLKRYYNFGLDDRISQIRHNHGGVPAAIPEGTEILARYYLPTNEGIHNKPSVWSYKNNDSSGRVLLEGSHPEEVSSGEPLGLTVSMIKYALDGRGPAIPKHVLHNMETFVANRKTGDMDIEHVMIGDLQCHHFPVFVPPGAKSFSLSLTSNYDCDFALMLNYGTYAFKEDESDYYSMAKGTKQSITLSSLEDGVWYVTVKCLTTVSPMSTDKGQMYKGRTDILNGVPYTISIKWNN